MKFRTGFVSNSSSSSYIVAMPDNFELPKNAEDFLDDPEYTTVKHLESALKLLKQNGSINAYKVNGTYELYLILDKANLLVERMPAGADDHDTIINVLYGKRKDVILKALKS